MKTNSILVLILVLPFLKLGAFGNHNINFEHINVNNGLSHYSVNSLYQDENGFIWIGTKDGLNKYDGNEITVFNQIKNNDFSLFGNNIRSLCGDKDGHLFMQCKSGLLIFDLKTELFTTIRRQGVSSISYGKKNLWFSVNDTIFSFHNGEKENLEIYYTLANEEMMISAILETDDNLMYVATNLNGLMIFDKNKKNVGNWDIKNVVYLYEDSKKNVWVCTRFDGLYKINFTGNLVHYQHNPLNPESLPNNFVRTICEDDFGYYWIGLFTGLCRMSAESEWFNHIQHNSHLSHGLSNSSVWSILNDKQGTLWIGTYFGGINIYNPKFSIFNFYDSSGNGTNSLSSPIVGGIIEDTNHNLWIGTDGGGLNFFDRKNDKFHSYTEGYGDNRVSSNTIKSLWLDEKRNNIWIGTHTGGLNKLDLTSKKITVFRHNPQDEKSIPNDYVRKIVERDDTLYLATRNSIGVFDLNTETCQTFTFKDINLINRELTDLVIDSRDRMWFTYSTHVYMYDLKNKRLNTFELNTNNVLMFFENSKNQLLAGTDGDGVYKFDEKNQHFNSFDELNKHLKSNYVIDIKESKGGYYYLSTNRGLVVVDTELQSSQILNNNTGFPLDALNENSIFISNKNEIFVGGINGMASFQERDLNMPRADYKVNITGIRVNNEKISPQNSSIINQSLSYQKEIKLKPKHTTLTLLFSTSNYVKFLKTDIQYQLVGFDKNWINANYSQNVTYTNLNPGKYTFRVKGKNQTLSGEYPESELSIIVLPPYYRTTLAYLIYILLIAGLAYILLKSYTSKIKLSTSLEFEKREKTHIKELNQSKLRFFTNISHELRTPLTLITNQIEVMLQMSNVPHTVYGKLLSIQRNSNRMKKLVTELIDFRKYEQGYLKLKVSEKNLIPFLNKIFLSFQELSNSKSIIYNFIYPQDEVLLWFDENQLEKVFYNLLANAFKYTPDKGTITLRIEEVRMSVMIYVIDNGIGIDKQSLEYIFDRFYQVENQSMDWLKRQGSGIGLSLAKGIVNLHKGEIGIESEPNVGSKFWIELPIGNAAFTDVQKIKSTDIDSDTALERIIPETEFYDEIVNSQKDSDSLNSTILIIEDNDELLELLSNVFQPIYKVITARNGLEGFEKATQIQPDIILTDVMMPKMSGVEMCSKLKSNFETSHIPIVLITARSTEDYMVEGLLQGADDYIVKPFNIKSLVLRCNNLINSRKQLQRKFAKQIDFEPKLVATNSIDQQVLEKATKIVEENIDNPNFDVNMFASEMWLSRTYLFDKIKGVTGQTPNEFITNIRLKKSIHYLLSEPETPIADIAINVGFSSSSYYIKKFSSLYGVTPAQYRKNFNNEIKEE